MVHPVATLGFGSEAEVYERSRPTYPAEAIAWLVQQAGIGAGAVVADLAAGTGKLTRLLEPIGARVLAIEPVWEMHQVLRRLLPSVPSLAGVAEALPLASSSLDAVCVAQAFHWFSADGAAAELARVLRSGASLAMLWNARDRSVDWVDQVWSIMDGVEKAAPWRNHANWRQSALGDRPEFGPMRTATFHHRQVVSAEGVVDRIRGVSHVAALEPEKKEAVLASVREMLASHPQTRGRSELRIPYRVDCYCWERL